MKNTAEGLRIEAEGLRSKPVGERKLDCKLGLQGCGDEEQHRRIAKRVKEYPSGIAPMQAKKPLQP